MTELQKIINFVRANTTIDIAEIHPNSISGLSIYCMWKGVCLLEGMVRFTHEAHPGDLLHELGHVALMPRQARPLMNGELIDVEGEASAMDVAIAAMGSSAGQPSDDDAASFWAFCVCRHLGLDDSMPFRSGYDIPDAQWDAEKQGISSVAAMRGRRRTKNGTSLQY